MALVIKEGGDCRGWLGLAPARSAARLADAIRQTSDGGGRGSASTYHGNQRREAAKQGRRWRRKNGPAKFHQMSEIQDLAEDEDALSAVASG